MVNKKWMNFCCNTSIAGFREVYESKSKITSYIWLTIVIASWICTGYQMCGEISEYFSEQTKTRISTVDQQDILYPPLRLCYSHWMHYMDSDKIKNLNLTKEAMLYGLRFLKNVYTTSFFNYTLAEQQFLTKMSEMGYKTVFEFLNAVARVAPAIGNISGYFDGRELIYDGSLLYCYILSSARISKYFHNRDRTDGKTILKFALPYETYKVNSNNFSHYVTFSEYFQYSKLWISSKTTYKLDLVKYKDELINFGQPILMYPIKFDQKFVSILPDVCKYLITFTASAFNWKSQNQIACMIDKKYIAANTTCRYKCRATKSKASNCTCQHISEAVVLYDDVPDVLCINDLVFLSPDNLAPFENRTAKAKLQTCDPTNKKVEDDYNKCIKDCSHACQIWKYDFTVVQIPRHWKANALSSMAESEIEIEYPSHKKIIMLIQEDSQSWQGFVGNVGGILGVWTGASILSLLQAIYYCCCTFDYH